MALKIDVTVRPACAKDVPLIFEKMKAQFSFNIGEEIPIKFCNTVDRLLKDGGFNSPDDPKRFHLLVAETELEGKLQIVGHAMYYYAYLAWCGTIGFLQCLYVDEPFRRCGIATRIFDSLARELIKNECFALRLCALDWNKNALACYDKLGGINLSKVYKLDVYHFDRKAMEKMNE